MFTFSNLILGKKRYTVVVYFYIFSFSQNDWHVTAFSQMKLLVNENEMGVENPSFYASYNCVPSHKLRKYL